MAPHVYFVGALIVRLQHGSLHHGAC
jgi:hypothetical protein